MNLTSKEGYLAEYGLFLEKYNSETISPIQIGEMIARLAQYYSAFMMESVEAERAFSLRIAEEEKAVDASGKAISSTKAKAAADTSPEAYKRDLLNAHIKSIERIMGALKDLQYGVSREMRYQGAS